MYFGIHGQEGLDPIPPGYLETIVFNLKEELFPLCG